jgi:hydrogenase nickel incorporation protein HypB
VELHERILAGNEATARHNREHFEADGVLAVNLMGSPGSGKTALLEATSRAWGGRRRLAAMSGDLETDNDARRLVAAGIPSVAITTGSACHLDAALVHRALHDAPWESDDPLDVLFIENVGNLVCPAIYDLGEAVRVVALALTEGEDKPLKYPIIFRAADAVVLTKADLLPHLDVDVGAIRGALARVMPEPKVILVSAKTGEGVNEWIDWLEERMARISARATRPHGHPHDHAHAHDHGHGHEHAKEAPAVAER